MHLYEKATESGVVYGSKAVGEPPLMQAFSVREALRQAVGGVRSDGAQRRAGQPGHPGGGVLGGRGGPGRGAADPAPAEPVAGRRVLSGLAERARAAAGGGCARGAGHRGRGPRATPRGTPAPRWSSAPDQTWGSVGGGNLEETAVRRARELIADGRRDGRDAGVAAQRARAARARPAVLRRRGPAAAGALPARPTVAIFGVGHVGFELARILSRLEVRLHLVDSRAEQLDELRLADVTAGVADVDRAPGGAGRAGAGAAAGRRPCADHDPRPRRGLRALRRRPPAAPVRGTVGEHRADRVERQVGAVPQASCSTAGHDAAAVDADHLPDRLPEIAGKEPAVIAVGVAAALLPELLEAELDAEPAGRRRASTVRLVTLYRATVLDAPGDPFAVGPRRPGARVRRRDRGPRRDRSWPAARTPRCRSAPRRGGRSTSGTGCCCPGSSTPTCTTRRSGRSAGWACRCSTGWTRARCRRRPGWPRTRTPRRSPRVPRRTGAAGHHHGAGLRVALRQRDGDLFTAAERAGCGSPPGRC